MRRARILGTPARTSARKPQCKQCIEANLFDPTENVVRFMGAWACLDHYMVEIKGTEDRKPLREFVHNRQHRRQVGLGHVR